MSSKMKWVVACPECDVHHLVREDRERYEGDVYGGIISDEEEVSVGNMLCKSPYCTCIFRVYFRVKRVVPSSGKFTVRGRVVGIPLEEVEMCP